MLNADKLLKKGIKQVMDAGIVPGTIEPKVKIIKSINRMGVCSRKSNGTYEISINEVLLENTEHCAMTTMVHEILHTCKGCMNHGKLWKSYAAKMNSIHGYNITTTSVPSERGIKMPIGKYSIVCSNDDCTLRVEKNRMCDLVRNPERYICTKCKAKLKVIVNSKNGASPKAIKKPVSKYVIQCTKCSAEFPRTRMSKVIKNLDGYKCKCGGCLKLK